METSITIQKLKRRIKSAARYLLPPPVLRRVERRYYRCIVRSFSEKRWPGALVVRQLIRAGDCVVDAGANVGYVTKLLADWVGPDGVVCSIEPVPRTFDLIADTVKELNLKQVRLFSCAISSHRGEATMEVPPNQSGGKNFYGSRIVVEVPAKLTAKDLIRVPLRTLDDIASETGRPVSFIKIDVEGHELDAIRGAVDILHRDRPSLFIEVSGDPDDAASRATQLFELLKALDYHPYFIDNTKLVRRHPGDRSTDYFFLIEDHLKCLAMVHES